MGQGLWAVTPSQPAAAVKTHRGARGPTPRSRRWPVIPSSGHDARDRRAHAKSRRSQKQGWHRREGRARACAHPGGGGVPKAWHPDTAASPPADTGNEGPGATAIERLCLCPPTRASPGQWGGGGGDRTAAPGEGRAEEHPCTCRPPLSPHTGCRRGGRSGGGCSLPAAALRRETKREKRETGKTGKREDGGGEGKKAAGGGRGGDGGSSSRARPGPRRPGSQHSPPPPRARSAAAAAAAGGSGSGPAWGGVTAALPTGLRRGGGGVGGTVGRGLRGLDVSIRAGGLSASAASPRETPWGGSHPCRPGQGGGWERVSGCRGLWGEPPSPPPPRHPGPQRGVGACGCIPPRVGRPGLGPTDSFPAPRPVGPVRLSRSPPGRGGRRDPRSQWGLYSPRPEPGCLRAGKGKGSATIKRLPRPHTGVT